MTWDIVDDKDHSGETWIDLFSEQMSSMNNITA